jgi:hypothetical protein
MKINRKQLRKLIKETMFLYEGDDHHKTEPKVTNKETAQKIQHHAGPKTNDPLKLKYFHPKGGHYSLELKNAKYVDGHVRFDANVFGKQGVDLGFEGHFEIPINSIGKKSHSKDHSGNLIQGTEIDHPHGEVSIEIAKQIPKFLGDAKLSLKGIAGTDFARHDEYGWSIGIAGSIGGSKH